CRKQVGTGRGQGWGQAGGKGQVIEVSVESARVAAALKSGAWGFGGLAMHRFIDGEDRLQQTLLPHSLEDYVGAENPVRVIEAFIDEGSCGPGICRDDAGGDGTAGLPSLDAAEDLPLWLPQPRAVEPAAGTRSTA